MKVCLQIKKKKWNNDDDEMKCLDQQPVLTL